MFGNYRLASAFQPVFSSAGGTLEIFGFEGLLRPGLGNIDLAPAELFNSPQIDNTKLLERISREIHIQNFTTINQSNALLFLNINPALIGNPGQAFREVGKTLETLATFGCPPSKVVFEIVENKVVDNAMITDLCLQLRRTGAKVAIDDYGIDHSNWDRFSAVQPEILKLDGKVFKNLCKSPFAERALQQLVTSLNEIDSKLLVEGIESSKQFDVALSAGVPLLQGYYLGRPQPASFWLNKQSFIKSPHHTAKPNSNRNFAIN